MAGFHGGSRPRIRACPRRDRGSGEVGEIRGSGWKTVRRCRSASVADPLRPADDLPTLLGSLDEAEQLQVPGRRKEYFAICEGRIALDGDVINKPLAPHPATTQRMILPSANPPRQAMFKEAITEYRVSRRYRGYTAVELFPKTGRTHQLRVHMSSIGHPIVGDRMYGGRPVSEMDLAGSGDTQPLIEYQALHARRLRIMHPILEKPLELNAPLSPLIERIVELLELHRQL